MKFLKGIITFFTGLAIFILVLSLTFTYIFKNIIQKQIIGDAVKDIVITEYIKDKDIENKDKIEELLEDKDAKKLVNIVIDEYLESLRTDNYQVSEESLDTIIDLCIEHKKELEEITNEEIKIEDIKSQETRNNLRQAFNEGFDSANNDIGETGSTIINYYSNYTSTGFKVALVCSILSGLILIGLINWSYCRPMRTLGTSLLITGIFISIMYVLINLAVKELIKRVDEISLSINTKSILILAIFEIILGILLLILQTLIKKAILKRKESVVETEEIKPDDIKKRNYIIVSILVGIIVILNIIIFINMKNFDFTPLSKNTNSNNNYNDGNNVIQPRNRIME